MLYHITYTKRDGSTEVGRVSADDRRLAIANAAFKFGVRTSAIRSAVALPAPRPIEPVVLPEGVLCHSDTAKGIAEGCDGCRDEEAAIAEIDAEILASDPTASTPGGHAAWQRQRQRDYDRKRAAEVAHASAPAHEPF